MKIEIEITGDNEGTDSPWWAIVNPKQNMSMDLGWAAQQITGPFFSRKEAEDFLAATRYNFGRRAAVWCFSGYYSRQYKEAIRKAEGPQPTKRFVYLPQEVRGDGPFRDLRAPSGTYIAYRNKHGAVSVMTPDGRMLGVKPGEYRDAGGVAE